VGHRTESNGKVTSILSGGDEVGFQLGNDCWWAKKGARSNLGMVVYVRSKHVEYGSWPGVGE
jgi:hypothetical protein